MHSWLPIGAGSGALPREVARCAVSGSSISGPSMLAGLLLATLLLLPAPAAHAQGAQERQAAAELFPAGSNERQVAGEMIAKLEGASMASWNPDDMQLLDSCLVDEGSEACVAFSNAMTALRELHEGSPGNA